jgi:hypothetical protein
MGRIAAVLLVVSGIIHLLPLPGLLGAPQLLRLYGVPIADPNLLILMQHRAGLFGLLGLLMIAAAWRPAPRPAAVAAGLASVVSFIVLAALVPGHNAQIQRVVVADWVVVACLLGVAVIGWLQRRALPGAA